MPKFKATVDTASAERRLLVFIEAVPNELAQATQTLANRVALLYGAYAPGGNSGRLARGIRVVSAQGRSTSSGRFQTGRQFAVIATARSREGYDYVGVTRFGHRMEFIVPKHDRHVASVVSTRRPRKLGHEKGAALRIPLRASVGGLYRHKVRGFHPTHDWAAVASLAAGKELDIAARELSHNLERRFR